MQKIDRRPVTMEGQKFEIPEDPSPTLPGRSPLGPIFVDLFFGALLFSGKKIFYKEYFKDVSGEFDEFQVSTHLCKLRCWYL